MRIKDPLHGQGWLPRYQWLDALLGDQGLLAGDFLRQLSGESWRVGLEARHLSFPRVDISAVGQHHRLLAAYHASYVDIDLEV